MQLGTLVIDHLVVTITEKELQQAGETWKQVHLSTVISKRNTMKGLNVPEYGLKVVKGRIHTIREVIVQPFMTTIVKGITNLMTHSKCMNVVAEPFRGYSDHIAMARSYGVLKLGRGKIDVCLRNHKVKQITLPKTAVGHYSKRHYKLNDTFKMCECSCWAIYGIFRSHWHGQILWGIKSQGEAKLMFASEIIVQSR